MCFSGKNSATSSSLFLRKQLQYAITLNCFTDHQSKTNNQRKWIKQFLIFSAFSLGQNSILNQTRKKQNNRHKTTPIQRLDTILTDRSRTAASCLQNIQQSYVQDMPFWRKAQPPGPPTDMCFNRNGYLPSQLIFFYLPSHSVNLFLSPVNSKYRQPHNQFWLSQPQGGLKVRMWQTPLNYWNADLLARRHGKTNGRTDPRR